MSNSIYMYLSYYSGTPCMAESPLGEYSTKKIVVIGIPFFGESMDISMYYFIIIIARKKSNMGLVRLVFLAHARTS
jgi:hypothetical protein